MCNFVFYILRRSKIIMCGHLFYHYLEVYATIYMCRQIKLYYAFNPCFFFILRNFARHKELSMALTVYVMSRFKHYNSVSKSVSRFKYSNTNDNWSEESISHWARSSINILLIYMHWVFTKKTKKIKLIQNWVN